MSIILGILGWGFIWCLVGVTMLLMQYNRFAWVYEHASKRERWLATIAIILTWPATFYVLGKYAFKKVRKEWKR